MLLYLSEESSKIVETILVMKCDTNRVDESPVILRFEVLQCDCGFVTSIYMINAGSEVKLDLL